MYTVKKDGKMMTVRERGQLAAFLNNGWVEVSKTLVDDTAKSEPLVNTKEEDMAKVASASKGVENYTKEQINEMKSDELKRLAEELGIETEGKRYFSLKSEVIAKAVR